MMEANELIVMLLAPASQVALIMALAELIKSLGCPTKFIPLIDLVLGIISGICVFGLMQGMGIANGIMIGLALGLSACGLYSGIKNVTEAIK